ncbi:MAG: UDP-glucose 4-epimerase [candidate division Zixibacteria bacterium CG_4_9_14_3_um_filter_46_8]|nr:MAG: UDP-glucose 4-epimerase [candidate division Zixibacteria bacterium CG_4_9_14_3_um_filter_46_8]
MADIIITGGAGFIGSNLADKLLTRGFSVAVVDDLSSGFKENLPASVRLHRVDIRSAVMNRIFEIESPKYIFHLAAQLNVRRSVADPIFDADVNVMGTINLLQAAKIADVEKIIFTSTGGAIYGEQEYFPADENHPTNPDSPYGITKLTCEKYIQFYYKTHGLKYCIFRLANVFGPRQSAIGEAGVVAGFYHKFLSGEEAFINGDGGQTRDFVFVGDVVEALVKALDYPQCNIFNIGTSKEATVLDLFRMMRDIAGSRQQEKFAPAKAGEQRRSVITHDRVTKELGWEPQVDLRAGLKKTFEFFKTKKLQFARV